MYTIASVIYGIPLNTNDLDPERSPELEELIETDFNGSSEAGYLSYYSGSSKVKPMAFGVEIDGFDECNHHIDVSTIKMIPTQEQIDKFNVLFAGLEVAIQTEMVKLYGNPRVFFLWSTS